MSKDLEKKSTGNDIKDFDKIIENREKLGSIIAAENFILPDIDDFLKEDISLEHLKQVEEQVSGESGNGLAAKFYYENPYTTELGYNEKANIFVLSGKPLFLTGEGSIADEEISLNRIDGDTIDFNLFDIKDGGKPFSLLGSKYNSFAEYVNKTGENNKVPVRFLGLNTPELIHYSLLDKNTPTSKLEFITLTVKELKKANYTYIYDRYKYKDADDETKIKFIRLNKDELTWFELISDNYKTTSPATINGKTEMVTRETYKFVSACSYSYLTKNHIECGKKLQTEVKDMMTKAEDILLVLDAKSFSRQFHDRPQYNNYRISKSISSRISDLWEQAMLQNEVTYHFGYPGRENNNRFLGMIYLKIAGKWINLNKYLITVGEDNYPKEVEILPQYNNSPIEGSNYGFAADAFKMWSFNNYNNSKIMEELTLTNTTIEKRNNIFKNLTMYNIDQLKDFTVILGDTLLMVPPTSIKHTTQTTNDRLPLLRANGSATKGVQRSSTMLEMTLYFNEAGINGIPVADVYPNGRDTTYYMNGLRALIAQFKLTPFLPIENKFINEILNIEAVTLNNLQVSTVPGYPRCLAATLVLEEFDARVYMPELPPPNPEFEDIWTNTFAKAIDFDLLRYYYQRIIKRGNQLSGLKVNDPEYMKQTFGSVTALQPISHEDSYINFYVPNKEELDKKLQLKLEAEARAIRVTEKENDFMRQTAKDMGEFFGIFRKTVTSDSFYEITEKLTKTETIDGNKYELSFSTSNNELNCGMGFKSRLNKSKFEKFVNVNSMQKAIFKNFDDNDFKKNYLEPFVNKINSGLNSKSFSFVESIELREEVNLNEEKIYFNIDVFVNTSLIGEDTVSIILSNRLIELGLTKDDLKTFYKDGIINLRMYIPISSTRANLHTLSDIIKIDTYSSGYKAMQQCYDGDFIVENTSDYQDSMANDKEKIDYEYYDSIQFDEYPTGNIILESLACVYGNNMARVSLQSSDGFAHQYLGGQDVMLEASIKTTDANAVRLIKHLPKLAARYMKDYNKILSVWPIRIDSKISRLFGVNEVLIESVSTNTVPGHPGLYSIVISMISVDRSLRNREALKRIEGENAGSATDSTENANEKRNYFSLQKTMSEVEIYPDLELPTLDEMSSIGYEFVRYTAEKNQRKYVDPDFYFVYNHPIASRIFRETLLHYFENQDLETKTYKLTDNMGASLEISNTDGGSVYKIINSNEIYKIEEEEYNKILEEQDKVKKDIAKKKSDKNTLKDNIKETLESSINTQYWSIGEKLNIAFTEKIFTSSFSQQLSEEGKTETVDNAKVFKTIIEDKHRKIKDIIREELSNPIQKNKKDKLKNVNGWNEQYKYVNNKILRFCNDFFSRDTGKKLTNELCGNNVAALSVIKNKMYALLQATSGAYSGRRGFQCNVLSNKDWEGRQYVIQGEEMIPKCIIRSSSQDYNGLSQATSLEEAMSYGIEFGMFGIPLYDKDSLIGLIPEDWETDNDRKYVFLDPYYNKDNKKFEEYKRNILTSIEFQTEAYFRNLLVWMYILCDKEILYSLSDIKKIGYMDFMSDINQDLDSESEDALDSYTKFWNSITVGVDKLTGGLITSTVDAVGSLFNRDPMGTSDLDKINLAKELGEIHETIKEDFKYIGFGKIFAANMLSLTAGDYCIFNAMLSRDYDELNAIIASVNSVPLTYKERNRAIIDKLLLALVGKDIVHLEEEYGSVDNDLGAINENTRAQRIYIQAADDPRAYLLHSYYDMIRNDYRGRMLRAFPTFYMLFIDEGNKISQWQLHDNFYNVNAISDIEIVKSRKIAADTANITMSNMYKTYTTEDEDMKELPTDYLLKDAWNSIFSPRTYYMKEEQRRLDQPNISRATLFPGTRLHIRMGYGANAANLPTVFNGAIAEVGTGPVMQIVAQGDGVELMNPITITEDADDLQNADNFVIPQVFKNWFTEGITPKEMMTTLMTSRGGWLKKAIYDYTHGRFFNYNPFGIIHFGDQQYDKIFKAGEVVQNIYECSNYPTWGDSDSRYNSIDKEYSTKDSPKISVHVFGKSFWDLLQISASVGTDYIGAVAPFGLRSTVFYGAPRYYYAYDYVEVTNKTTGQSIIREKRKPFRQNHVYTSYSDIIANSITASDKDVRTCAVGIYNYKGWLGSDKQKTVGPMWADIDIYPEKQKTMTVDTQFLAKGSTTGKVIPGVNWWNNEFGEETSDMGGGHAIAWRITANALKNATKDMYKGELTTLGDPSIKPYDRVYFCDKIENMDGQFDVEATVLRLNTETGFTSSILPDCIAVVDDRYEQMEFSMSKDIVGTFIGVYIPLVVTSTLFVGKTRPLLGTLLDGVGKLGDTNDIVKMVGKIIGQDDLTQNASFLKGKEGLANVLGVNLYHQDYRNYMLSIDNFRDLIPSKGKLDKYSDISKMYKNYYDMVDELDPAKAASSLDKFEKNTSLNKKDLDEVKNTKDTLNNIVKNYNDEMKTIFETIDDIEIREAKKLLEKLDKEDIKGAKELIAKLGKVTDKDSLKVFADAHKLISKNASKLGDDVNDFYEMGKNSIGIINDLLNDKTVFKSLDAITDLRKVDKVFDMVKVVGSGLLGGIIGMALEYIVTLCVTKSAYEWIERKMKNIQVLQVFPIAKNGKVYTAGLDGQKGVVVGSPTYEEMGFLEEILNKVIVKDPSSNSVANLLRSFFFSQEMEEIAKRYNKKAGTTASDDNNHNLTLINQELELLKKIGSEEISRMDAVSALVVEPRIYNLTSPEGKIAFQDNKVDNIKDPRIETEFYPVKEYLSIKKRIDKRIMTIEHDGHSGYGHSNVYDMTFNSKPVRIMSIEGESQSNFPLLRTDTLIVLDTILEQLELEVSKKDGGYYAKNYFDEHKIILKCCLTLGKNSGWGSTGYYFRLEVLNSQEFLSVVKRLQKELVTKNGDSLFMYQQSKTNNPYCLDFIVYPKKY